MALMLKPKCAHDRIRRAADGAYYTLRRTKRLLSARAKLRGPRSGYIGQEVFIALVDAAAAPYRHDLRQLSLEVLCTNRDLPILDDAPKLSLETGDPVGRIELIAPFRRPRSEFAHVPQGVPVPPAPAPATAAPRASTPARGPPARPRTSSTAVRAT